MWRFAAALIVTLPLAATAAYAADDAALCTGKNTKSGSRIESCNRAIASGKFSGSRLSKLLTARGYELRRADSDAAMASFEEAIRSDPNAAYAFLGRGNIYLMKSEYGQAVKDYDEAVRLDRSIQSILAAYGMAGDEGADHERAVAIRDYNDINVTKPVSSMAFGAMFGLDEGARRNKLLSQNPNAVAAATLRQAETYELHNEYDRALQGYDDAIRLDPKFLGAYYKRGKLRAKKEDFVRAIDDFASALDVIGSADVPNDERGWMQSVLRRDREGAEAALKSARASQVAQPEPSSPSTAMKPDPKIERPAAAATDLDVSMPAKSPSLHGKRVALVMGNADYRSVSKLSNTINDARTMRETLQKAGFEVVYGEDLDKRAMGRLIGEFGSIVKDSEAAIVYFAGHGSTFSDIPYVVPVDSKYEKLQNIPDELIQVESLVAEMRKARGVRLVILDACRDNEREVQLRRQDAASRGEARRGGEVNRGLARLENPNGLIVVYATQHMTTASDGFVGGNSPFTGALAKFLLTPNLDIKDVLFRAGQDVIARTNGTQRPEISISLYDAYVLMRQ